MVSTRLWGCSSARRTREPHLKKLASFRQNTAPEDVWLYARSSSRPVPPFDFQTVLDGVSNLSMTDRAICVYDDDRRRAAYGVGDEGLAERIHRDRFEERPFPSVEELRDR